MADITITVSGLSGSSTADLPEGATVADARQAANINEGLQVRRGGHPVADDAPLSNGDQLVTAAPSAKHGVIS